VQWLHFEFFLCRLARNYVVESREIACCCHYVQRLVRCHFTVARFLVGLGPKISA
jgi:hypothetical protein